MVDLDAAVTAIERGKLVVYPTETVYGLGADALDATAIDRVYAAKGRDRSTPISLGVPSVAAALDYVDPTDRERQFMEAFLPGPVTVVCRRQSVVPDRLTAGRDRVGVRVPDHDLAQRLLTRTGPLTATSANLSGAPSTTDVATLAPELREQVAVVLDAGPTPGTGSTVVDVSAETIHRRGHLATEIEEWLASH